MNCRVPQHTNGHQLHARNGRLLRRSAADDADQLPRRLTARSRTATQDIRASRLRSGTARPIIAVRVRLTKRSKRTATSVLHVGCDRGRRTTTAPTTIWSCTCARMHVERRRRLWCSSARDDNTNNDPQRSVADGRSSASYRRHQPRFGSCTCAACTSGTNRTSDDVGCDRGEAGTTNLSRPAPGRGHQPNDVGNYTTGLRWCARHRPSSSRASQWSQNR